MYCVAIHKTNGKIGLVDINILPDGTYQVVTDRDTIHYYRSRTELESKWKLMYVK